MVVERAVLERLYPPPTNAAGLMFTVAPGTALDGAPAGVVVDAAPPPPVLRRELMLLMQPRLCSRSYSSSVDEGLCPWPSPWPDLKLGLDKQVQCRVMVNMSDLSFCQLVWRAYAFSSPSTNICTNTGLLKTRSSKCECNRASAIVLGDYNPLLEV